MIERCQEGRTAAVKPVIDHQQQQQQQQMWPVIVLGISDHTDLNISSYRKQNVQPGVQMFQM